MSIELFDAIEQHDLNRLASLLKAGADANILRPQYPQWRPLHAAIEELEHGGSSEALILLLRHGADVDGWDGEFDATPLLMALFRRQLDAVRVLLVAGADPNVLGGEGDSPLRWSVEQGDCETAEMLLRCGAYKTIDGAGGASGMTALGQATSRLDIPMMQVLLSAGANPRELDADRRTAWERLPTRDASDTKTWDRAKALLDQSSSTSR